MSENEILFFNFKRTLLSDIFLYGQNQEQPAISTIYHELHQEVQVCHPSVCLKQHLLHFFFGPLYRKLICLHSALLCLFVQVGGWCKATSTVHQLSTLQTFTDTWTNLLNPKQYYWRQSRKKESIGNASVQELLPNRKPKLKTISKPIV